MGDQGSVSCGSSTSALSLRSVLCYAQEDKKFASRLIKHLSANQISVSDLPKELPAGHDRQAELRRRIGEANLVIVLVGPDFLQDHRFELQLIEERLPANDWRFIPILAREVPRQGIPLLERCQLLPRSEKALASLEASQRDKVLKEISNEIKKTSDEIEMLIKRGPARQSLQDGVSEVAREEKSAPVPVLPHEQTVAAEGRSGAIAGIQPALPVERKKRWRQFATWKVVTLLALFFCVLCVSIGIGYLALRTSSPATEIRTGHTATTIATCSQAGMPGAVGLTTELVAGDCVGISVGQSIFDQGNGLTISAKLQAAALLRAGRISQARAYFQLARRTDPTDAEAGIYDEDLLYFSQPHLSLLVGVHFSHRGDLYAQQDALQSRAILQGAFVYQKEYNRDQGHRMKLVLLIDNTGYSTETALEAARLTQKCLQAQGLNALALIGWPFGLAGDDVVQEGMSSDLQKLLSNMPVPIVASVPTDLSGLLPNFFSVVPSLQSEAAAIVAYMQHIGARNPDVIYDENLPSAQALAHDLQSFTNRQQQVYPSQAYTGDSATGIQDSLKFITRMNDALIFIGAAPSAVILQKALASQRYSHLVVLGTDILYHYVDLLSSTDRAALVGLHFLSFAYPDEYGYFLPDKPPPAFFADYLSEFSPPGQSEGPITYGKSREESEVILAYDAFTVVFTAFQRARPGATLLQGLESIAPAQPVQGISGQIAFGPDGYPIDKAVLVLKIVPGSSPAQPGPYTEQEMLISGRYS
ncbi:TIR domain-containing protein [Thermogemmatispora sp.]|uniref:TIR domain-containing protein n=1 Tax=Thermogemmatispora sp. TaxID=1968838 RepID=UPI00257B8C1C|nr:TIR domain-containing protein [Thermogemmatispora sp.]